MATLLTAALLFFASIAQGGSGAHGQTCEVLFSVDQMSRKPWFENIGFVRTEQTLRRQPIVDAQDLHQAMRSQGKKGQGLTPGLLLVTFKDGTRALWKPGPSGAVEVAAYKLARSVGSRLVPPTVERSFAPSEIHTELSPLLSKSLIGQKGSLQYFVDTPHDLTRMTSENRVALWEKVPLRQRAERDIYNFVFGNWDLHWGNVLIDQTGSIVQIDNAEIQTPLIVRYGERPFIRRIGFSKQAHAESAGLDPSAFPFETAIHLEKPGASEFVTALKSRSEPAEFARYVITKLEGPMKHDLTMNVVAWDGAFWIQATGFQNYGVIRPAIFPSETIEAYRRLTYESLREALPETLFSKRQLHLILKRRDQILEATRSNS